VFERYTDKAQRVIFFGRYEAACFQSSFIEPEHLLLGILREDKALKERLEHGAAIERDIRQGLSASEDTLESALKNSSVVDLPLSVGAQRVLAYCVEEAERAQQRQISPLELLLGILRQTGTPAEKTLSGYGITLGTLRANAPPREAPSAVISALRKRFAPLASRLTPEIEPAVTFLFRPGEVE
jgi:ATP-dependent Clp protease ATP-binding subunit ClpC